MKFIHKILMLACTFALVSCAGFLDEQVPQGTMDDNKLKDPAYVDNLVISAYAVFISAEDINASFSMWNYDVRSDDAYKGGNGTEDGDVFHALEVSTGIMTTAWNISDMWPRLYNCISRVNMALSVLEGMEENEFTKTRIGEMRFLRGHAHFLLKQLYKNIVFVMDADLPAAEYSKLSNTTYTNDQGWQLIADDFKYAFDNLPDFQADKGRPTKAAAAAYLAKTYLYKAYRQDDPKSHAITSINRDDLAQVVAYTSDDIIKSAGYGLESDFVNNFLPEPQYENGVESLWAMQYSLNDGTTNGNCNWGNGLICPNIPGVTDGGCDFYKPSQNLVNAFRTDADGHPLFDTFNNEDYDAASDFVDPRLFHTVGIPGFPYEYNPELIIDKTPTWSRSNGLYGYNVTLKQNVDPASGYLVKGSFWGTSLNHIVLRYADVMLMRAEALIQLNDGRIDEAMTLINDIRLRAKRSLSKISNYPADYGAKFHIQPYSGTPDQATALKYVKFERRLELAMESDRFFDLVRWGEAAEVLNKYYAEEADNCSIYESASFTANKNEYLPIPHNQVSASAGYYTQNIGGW